MKRNKKHLKRLMATSKAIDRALALERGLVSTYRGLHVIHLNSKHKRQTKRSVRQSVIAEQQE